jgi:hypothetical protein
MTASPPSTGKFLYDNLLSKAEPKGEHRVGHAVLSGVDHQFVDLAHILTHSGD